MEYKDEFFKALHAAENGEISEDELLSVAKRIVLEKNPQLPDDKAGELAAVVIKGVKGQSNVGFISGSDGPSVMIADGITTVFGSMPDGSYELPDGSSLQVGPPQKKKPEFSQKTQANLKKLMARVDELIEPVDTVRLHPKRGKTTVFDSKMGGVPYFPKSMEYPVVREGEHKGKPLLFLAQLNFGKLPKLPGFPTEGMLQFFAGCDDDELYGIDFDNPFDQNRFRVIYHENVITDASELYSDKDMPEFDVDDGYFPFKGEFLLAAEKAKPVGISAGDFRLEKVVAAAYNEIFGGKVECMYDWNRTGKGINDFDEELADAVFVQRDLTGTRMGGYPFFTQDDPREFNEEYAKCTVLLFQSDSENGGDKDNWDDQICWGDLGVANFFISPEDLAKRDFSHVMYNWDCS